MVLSCLAIESSSEVSMCVAKRDGEAGTTSLGRKGSAEALRLSVQRILALSPRGGIEKNDAREAN